MSQWDKSYTEFVVAFVTLGVVGIIWLSYVRVLEFLRRTQAQPVVTSSLFYTSIYLACTCCLLPLTFGIVTKFQWSHLAARLAGIVLLLLASAFGMLLLLVHHARRAVGASAVVWVGLGYVHFVAAVMGLCGVVCTALGFSSDNDHTLSVLIVCCVMQASLLAGAMLDVAWRGGRLHKAIGVGDGANV